MSDSNLLILAKEFKKLRDETKKVLAIPVGPKGDKGDKGDTGERGLNGKDGRDGKDGLSGLPGANGRDGVNGKDGVDGVDGVGIASVEVLFDNTLLVRLTDGTEIDAGEITVGSSGNGQTVVVQQYPSDGGGSGAAPPTQATIEVDLGNTPRRSGKFIIADLGLVLDTPIIVSKAGGPYTGKGTLADEAEMDQITVAACVTSSTTIQAYWQSVSPVRGNVKFNYLKGA
jgi:hypothetical protein